MCQLLRYYASDYEDRKFIVEVLSYLESPYKNQFKKYLRRNRPRDEQELGWNCFLPNKSALNQYQQRAFNKLMA